MTKSTWFSHFVTRLLIAALTVFGLFANPRPAAASITDADLQKLYVVYFGRPADPTGLAYWRAVAASSSTAGQYDEDILASISNSFASSQEFTSSYAGLNSDGIVTRIYTNLFGRAPEPAGLAFWSLPLAQGIITLPQLVNSIAAGAQGADATALASKIQAAAAFTTALDNTEEIVTYNGDAAHGSAKSWLASINSAESLSAAVSRLDSAIGEMMSAGDPKPVAPVATDSPTLSPLTPTVGDALVCSNGTWTGSPAPTFKIEWLRGTSIIPNQNSATYVTTAADAGQLIYCKVTATIGSSATSVMTAGVRVLAPVAPTATVAPALSPLAPTVGDVIACSNGTWTGSPAPTLKFEWLRGTAVIPNQTAATYMTTAADIGQDIFCKVTATIGNLATSVNTGGVRVKAVDPLQTIRVVVPVDIARAPAGFTQLTISGRCAPDPGLVAAAISAGTISAAPPTLEASRNIYLSGGAFKQEVTLEYQVPASLRSLYTTSEVRIVEFDRLNSEGTPAEGNLGVNVVPLS